MATPTEIVAYIGAAAWLPQIAVVIYKATIKPTVTIVPEKSADIGFTTNGPIFNLRLAVSSAKKDTIIDHVGVSIQHQNGDTHEFAWAGMKETFSEIKDRSGNTQFVEKEFSPIALVLNRLGLVERFFRFQDPTFHKETKEATRKATDLRAYLKTQKPDYHDDFLKSKEVHDVVNLTKKFFFWKTGKYTVTFHVKSPNKIVFNETKFIFELTEHQISDISKNIEQIDTEVENIIKADVENYEQKNVNWLWANSSLDRVE